MHGGVVREPTYSVKLILTNQFPLICRTTKTIELYHRSSFTPQDEHIECETEVRMCSLTQVSSELFFLDIHYKEKHIEYIIREL